MDWSEEVNDFLTKKGCSVAEFARLVEIPYRTAQSWHLGDREPNELTKKAVRMIIAENS